MLTAAGGTLKTARARTGGHRNNGNRMSSFTRLRLLQVTVAAAFAAALSWVAPANAQSIAVVVNGQPILTSEVQARLALMKLSGGKASVEAARDELIEDKLKVTEAKRYGMAADPAQVEAAYASIAGRMKLTPQQFTQAIQQRGVSAQTLKDRITAELTWAQLVRRKFAAQIAAREQDYIGQAAGKADNKAIQYTLRQVVFVLPKGASDAQVAQRRAEAIAAKSRFPGCDQAVAFASKLRDVAVRDPVVRSSGAMGKELNDILAKVSIGGLTEPQRSDDGIEMIAVCARKDIADDSVFKQQAMDQASGKQVEEQAKKYLEQIKSRAIIQVRR